MAEVTNQHVVHHAIWDSHERSHEHQNYSNKFDGYIRHRNVSVCRLEVEDKSNYADIEGNDTEEEETSTHLDQFSIRHRLAIFIKCREQPEEEPALTIIFEVVCCGNLVSDHTANYDGDSRAENKHDRVEV